MTMPVPWNKGLYVRQVAATAVPMWLVAATEVDHPRGVKPIEWVLYTSLPERDIAEAMRVISYYKKRWLVEVTFEETRAYLGVETQRQWSDLAIERETPCLLGLYSVVALLGEALHRRSPIAIRVAAWYPKAEATFSDVLAAVRRECWGFLDIRTSRRDRSYVEIPRSQLDRLLNAVCYAH